MRTLIMKWDLFCVALIMRWDLFCVAFFPSKMFWLHFAISACPRTLSLLSNSGMMSYSNANQKSRTNDHDLIHGSSQRVSSTYFFGFVPHACIPLFSSAFSVHHPLQMAHATIAILNSGPDRLFWNQFFLASSAHFSRIHFLHSEHRAGFAIFFPPWKNCCSPFVKSKVTSQYLHATVMSCSGPSAIASVCCFDATSWVGTSSTGVWKVRMSKIKC